MNRGGRAMAHVADHLSIENLERRYRACEDACSARHYQTIWLLAQGHTVPEVSALTSFAPRWIEELQGRYNALGLQAIGGSIQSPRPKNPNSAISEEVKAFKKTSLTRSPKKPTSIPTSRSRSGRRMNIGSA